MRALYDVRKSGCAKNKLHSSQRATQRRELGGILKKFDQILKCISETFSYICFAKASLWQWEVDKVEWTTGTQDYHKNYAMLLATIERRERVRERENKNSEMTMSGYDKLLEHAQRNPRRHCKCTTGCHEKLTHANSSDSQGQRLHCSRLAPAASWTHPVSPLAVRPVLQLSLTEQPHGYFRFFNSASRLKSAKPPPFFPAGFLPMMALTQLTI